jgi:hypothetical protein
MPRDRSQAWRPPPSADAEAVAVAKKRRSEAARKRTTEADGHAAMARAYMASGSIAAARNVLEALIDLDPDHPQLEVLLGFGRIVALHCRSSTSYQIREHIRYLYF